MIANLCIFVFSSFQLLFIVFLKQFQVFLNGVSYCDVFPANHNSVNIAGLAGGRMYEINLEVYPTEAMFLPHKSNKLVSSVFLNYLTEVFYFQNLVSISFLTYKITCFKTLCPFL